MATHPYFQAAAAELRRAILEKRHEIDAKKVDLTNLERELTTQIQQLKTDQRQKEAQAGSSQTDDSERLQHLHEAQEDLKEITAKENELRQRRADVLHEIDAMERDIMGIENMAKGLETRS